MKKKKMAYRTFTAHFTRLAMNCLSWSLRNTHWKNFSVSLIFCFYLLICFSKVIKCVSPLQKSYPFPHGVPLFNKGGNYVRISKNRNSNNLGQTREVIKVEYNVISMILHCGIAINEIVCDLVT